MIRVILLNLFLLLLPALLYFLYVYTLRWIRGTNEPADPAPILWLFAAGAMLMVASLGYYVEYNRQGAQGRYVEPVLRDGVVQPGRIE
jgi:hypothetical protein